MSDSIRLTDDQITLMLVERVASPMPPDLYSAVLASVHDAASPPRSSCTAAGPFGPARCLVAAALLIGGSLMVAGFAGSTLIVRPTSTPAPAVVEATARTEVGQTWTTSNDARGHHPTRNPTDNGIYYWRAIAYDRFDLNGWSLPTDADDGTTRAPSSSVAERARRRRRPRSRARGTFAVTPLAYGGTTVVSARTPRPSSTTRCARSLLRRASS